MKSVHEPANSPPWCLVPGSRAGLRRTERHCGHHGWVFMLKNEREPLSKAAAVGKGVQKTGPSKVGYQQLKRRSDAGMCSTVSSRQI